MYLLARMARKRCTPSLSTLRLVLALFLLSFTCLSSSSVRSNSTILCTATRTCERKHTNILTCERERGTEDNNADGPLSTTTGHSRRTRANILKLRLVHVFDILLVDHRDGRYLDETTTPYDKVPWKSEKETHDERSVSPRGGRSTRNVASLAAPTSCAHGP